MADPQEGHEPHEDDEVEAHRRVIEAEPIDELERRRRAAEDLPLDEDEDRARRRR